MTSSATWAAPATAPPKTPTTSTSPTSHFGLELIFDESQKDSNNEIWVSCYELVKFLHLNQCETVKVEGTKEWTRVYGTKDPAVPEDSASQHLLPE